MTTVIFDLDGTLCDSAPGITRSINHALVELGHTAYPENELRQFIGQPLSRIFHTLAGIDDQATITRAIELYRERFVSIGYKENQLYMGILEVLAQLVADGCTLCIATSKRKDIAVQTLEFLNIDTWFTQVHGCDLHRAKTDLLRDILADPGLNNNPMVMIGDREVDFKAAADVHIPSIAVRWGYGEEKELGLATSIVDKPADLPEAIQKTAQK